MMSTKPFYWLAQFIGWFSYCMLLVLSVYNRDASQINGLFLINIFIIIITGIVVTHIQRGIFIRLGWLELRLPKLLPKLILASVVSALVISFVDLLTDYWSKIGLWKEFSSPMEAPQINVIRLLAPFLGALLLVLFWNAIYFTFHFFQKSRKQEITNLELKASKRESELKNLRSQLNPHFLFNSLNSIRALVDMEPTKAKMSITTLSNLLRQSLILGRENLVTLESELGLAKSYLELEKIRFEERLKVEWELTPGLEYFEIPPFSLQMMVENAIKHGISNLKEGGVVRISAHDRGDVVEIVVMNSGTLDGVTDLGVGILNVKRRLALQYENRAEFHLNELNGEVTAKMIFKK